tara:strand:- start:237 stop:425 length:189 start_codon:yes stop_codon:yes gene_type:complete
MAKITIDDKEYDTDSFSDDAKRQLASLQFAQSEINRLNGLLAVSKTAMQAYSVALKSILEDN